MNAIDFLFNKHEKNNYSISDICRNILLNNKPEWIYSSIRDGYNKHTIIGTETSTKWEIVKGRILSVNKWFLDNGELFYIAKELEKHKYEKFYKDFIVESKLR